MFHFKGFEFTVEHTKEYTVAKTDLGGHYELRNSIPVELLTVVDAPKKTCLRYYPILEGNVNSKFKVDTLHEGLTQGQRILLDKIGQELCKM